MIFRVTAAISRRILLRMTMRRIIGMAMLGAALLFGVADMWLSVVPIYGAQAITMGRLWALISIRSMDLVETMITRHVWSPIWEVGIWPVLVAPAWSFFAVLGVLLFVFGRPKASDR
jgi:hypothetical protein